MGDVEKKFLLRGLKVINEPKYQLFTYDKLIAEVEKVAKDAADIIGFSTENSKILLHHFKWDAINLTEKFYEAESPTKFLKKNNITLIDGASHDEMVTVDRCHQWDEVHEVINLQCPHQKCIECWKDIVVTKYQISDRKDAIPKLNCPVDGCETSIPETFILQLFNDSETYEIYQKFIVNSFINLQSNFKWCPNRKNGCDKAVKIESDSKVEEVTCECGFTFCFSCDDIPHSPFPCIFVESFNPVIEHVKSQFHALLVCCPKCDKDYEFDFFAEVQRCDHCYEVGLRTGDMFLRQGIEINPIVSNFLRESQKLKDEYKKLRDLDDSQDSAEFVKTALKILHNFRQKYINFLVFSYFLDPSRNADFAFDSNVKELRVLIKNATTALGFPNCDTDEFIGEQKQTKVLEALVSVKFRVEVLAKSYQQEEWKFTDEKIQEAFNKNE